MPNNRSGSNRRRRSSTRRRETPVLAVQKQILASSKAQEIRAVPTTPDVMPLSLRRLRVHTIQAKIPLADPTLQFGNYIFDLGMFPDASSIGELFDQFRVAQIIIDFYAFYNTGGSETGLGISPFITAIDYTDTVSPTSVTELLDNETAQVSGSGVPFFRRVFSPRYIVPNGTTGDPASVSRAWIPCLNSSGGVNDTTWYGLKWGYFTTTPVASYTAVMTVVLNLRAVD